MTTRYATRIINAAGHATLARFGGRRPFYNFMVVGAVASLGLLGCAQQPPAQSAYPAADASASAGLAMTPGNPGAAMAGMDQHMQAMREMHEKVMRARTPQEREALMAEHMKLMQQGMAMMSGMSGMHGKGGMAGMEGKAGMAGMPGMAGMQGKEPMAGDMAMHHQMMEKRMAMMQSMMQMMTDRMVLMPARP